MIHYEALAGTKYVILLPLSPRFWDCRSEHAAQEIPEAPSTHLLDGGTVPMLIADACLPQGHMWA